MNKSIPYGKQFIDDSDIKHIIEVLKGDFITTGPKVDEFEDAICKQCNVKFAVAVSSGTAALHLASLTLLKENDKVLVTANTFLSTVNSILYAKAKPIFVDIDKEGNIDLDLCYDLLKKDYSIKALYGVHFSGNMIDQRKLQRIKQEFNIKILEDCAHSLGAYDNDIKAGSCKNSDVSILSFHPVKQITTGEGGAITTNDNTLYNQILSLRNNGVVKNNFENKEYAFDKKGNKNPWYYEMQQLGFNYRITDIQCALGLSQISKLDTFIKKRKKIAKRYCKNFTNNNLITPLYNYKENSAYHLFVAKIDFLKLKITKAEFFNIIGERGIKLQVHYIPVYKQPYYKKLGYNINLKNCEDYYNKTVSLPIYYSLSSLEQEFVIKTILGILEKYKK